LKDFELGWTQTIVPEFGIAKIKFPYTRADLNEVENTMRRCDSNRDGFIDRGEAWRNRWTHRNPFDDDANKDGKLSRLELAQRYARRRLLSTDAYQIYKKQLRNGSGVKQSVFDPRELARQDYFKNRGVAKRLSMDLFARFDNNRDRSLNEKEAEPIGIPFVKLDLDNDGLASRSEVEEVMALFQADASGGQEGVPGWFFELDVNRDNQLEMSEFAQEWSDAKVKEFQEYDLNSDGLVTAKELVDASQKGGQYVSTDAQIFAPNKTLISEIEIPDNAKIANLKLYLSVTHTYLSQIDGFLIGPDGQKIALFNGVGGTDDNFQNTVFDDNAPTPITKARAPYRGAFRPQALDRKQPGLAAFRGKNSKGTWQLVIGGPRNSRFGMLHQWGLTVETQ
ncbi:MAG: proprotein convertase P-domain-containing protein, partial [Planctomycetota bacterium]|nr:proprotein convertase P-domain-containing protein [Planctomycetota bacterium]